MDSKKRLILIALVLCLLIGAASILYTKIGSTVDVSQLGVAPSPAEEQSTESTSEASEAKDNRTKAPNFTATDKQGNAVELYDYLGKPIVMNFWASWCGPCQIEMPDFEEAYKNYGDDVNFLMVNMTDGSRETIETASAFIEEQGYTFTVLYDTAMEAAYGYAVYSLPVTYFLDHEGYLMAAAKGVINAETLQKGLDLILQK